MEDQQEPPAAMRKFRREHRNDLGSVFATSVVVVLGAAFCATLYATGSASPSPWVLALIIVPSALFLTTLLGVRWPRMGATLEFWHSVYRNRAADDRGLDYRPRRVEQDRVTATGQQKPMTAEEAREVRLLNGNTWSPSKARRRKSEDYLD